MTEHAGTGGADWNRGWSRGAAGFNTSCFHFENPQLNSKTLFDFEQVEEVKLVLRLLPIFWTTVVYWWGPVFFWGGVEGRV
jgi:hypothetical protein